jgi:hypothetical protein
LLSSNPILDLGTSGAVNFTENAAPALVAQDATLTQAGALDFAAGSLTFNIAANGSASDQLTILNQGSSVGQVGVSGNTVFYSGLPIGTFSGGTGTTPLTVNFNALATLPAVQAVLDDVAFSVDSEDPSTAPRTLNIQATDGLGLLSNVVSEQLAVTAVNDAPSINLTGTPVTFQLNGQPVTVGAGATVSDVDNVNFNGGTLSVAITGNTSVHDRLSLLNEGTGAGQIGVSGNNITYGGTVIGTATVGPHDSSAVVTLNANATPEAVQALIQNIQFSTSGGAGVTGTRSIQLTLTDGSGGTSTTVSQTVNVTTPQVTTPVINLGATSVTVNGSTAVAIAPHATLNDAGVANLNGGRLVVHLQGAPQARLNLAADSGFSIVRSHGRASLVFQGTVIGTVNGSQRNVVVNLNANATVGIAQNLLQALTVQASGQAQHSSSGLVKIALADGSGGISNVASESITLTGSTSVGGHHHGG